MKLYEKKNKKGKTNQNFSEIKIFWKQLFNNASTDISYGNDASKPEMDKKEFCGKKEEVLNEMRNLVKIREKIERPTIDQYQNVKWFKYRRKLLITSDFSKVINNNYY